MRSTVQRLGRLALPALLCCLSVLPAEAQECTDATPVADCVDMVPTAAPIDPALPLNCSGAFICDLSIISWDPATPNYISPDIAIGEPFTGGPTFYYDQTQNRFCTKLYSRIHNSGGGAAAGCDPVIGPCDVTVEFSVKETAASPNDCEALAIPWTSLGTYRMVIPTAPGALLPSFSHPQEVGVCWHKAAGDPLPETFCLRAEVNWTGETAGQDSNNTALSYYDLSSAERAAQIAMALDLSGSMQTELSPGVTRLEEAVDKAIMFALLVEPVDPLDPDPPGANQLGVYGFATAHASPEVPAEMVTYVGTDGLSHAATLSDISEIAPMAEVPVGGPVAAVSGLGAQLNTYGCTPIGQALLRARAGLAELAPPAGGTGVPAKAIVILSDGYQNVPPFVDPAPAWNCGGALAGVPIDVGATFGDEDIEIYSVFFGDPGWAYDLMWDIQNQTTGDDEIISWGALTSLDLSAAYYSIRGLVDDMIFFEEDGQTEPQSPATFAVNFDAAATKATVAVAWPYDQGESRLTVEYRRQGDEDWLSSEQLDTPLPTHAGTVPHARGHHVFRFNPGPGTTWEFRVVQLSGGESTPFTAAVFSPVRDAQIRAFLDDGDFTAGEPLPIHAVLRSAGVPLIGATVRASVHAPASAFSTTLRSYADQLTAAAVDPDANRIPGIAAQLRQALAQDTGSNELYPTRDLELLLRDDGAGADQAANDGIYSAAVVGADTEVAGQYDVTVIAEATLPSGRTVERTLQLSAIANIGPADPDRSEVRVDLSAPRDDGTRVATVTILPTDRFGNAAFPGSAGRIDVSVVGGTLTGSVVDPLDTSFTQTVELPAGSGGADVTVSYGEQSLGTTRVGGAAFHRRELSLHLGTATPHGRFGNAVSAGPTLALDYAYRFDEHLALRTELGWSDFDAPTGIGAGLLNLNAYLQYRWSGVTWTPYFETGLGYYDLESAGSALGFAAGIGAQRVLTPKWNFDINLHSHRVGGSLDLGFSQIRVGAIYKF